MTAAIYRYKMVSGGDGYRDMMMVRPDGNYVRYADHVAAIADTDAALTDATHEIIRLRDLLAYTSAAHEAETARADRAERMLLELGEDATRRPVVAQDYGPMSDEYRAVFRIAAEEVEGRK